MASVQNFALTAGEDQTLTMTARGASGAILDLTSAGISWRMIGRTGNAVLSKAGTIVSASAGTFTISLTDADTSGFRDGNYTHEALITISGTTTKGVSGRIRVGGQKALVTSTSFAVTNDQTNVFSTVAEATAANVADSVGWIFVSGYTSAADGRGGLYKRVSSATSGDTLTTANGVIFQRVYATTTVSAAPSSEGTHSTIDNSFTGDIKGIRYPVYHKITGTATAGQPTTGYDSTPEVMPFYEWLYNSSGWNESTSSNDGRTGIAMHRIRLQQAGQGDLYGIWCTGSVTSTRSGSTSVLANPAAVIVGGDLNAGADGVYLNPFECVLSDNGFDAAAVGYVVRLDRTISTAAKSAFWYGFRVQNETNTTEYDVAYSATGKAKFGLDLCFLTLDSNKAAITLKQDDRVYFEAVNTDASGLSRYPSAVGDTYVTYSSSLGALHFVANNSSVLQLYGSGSGAIFPVKVRTDSAYYVSTNQVVGARSTGWTAMTGSTDKATAYDTSTVTLAQLAGRVMALQAALTTHGLLGA